jgi:hypothetical protein
VEPVGVIGLIDRADGAGHIAEFAGEGRFHGTECHGQAEHKNGRDQNEFG